MKLPHARFAQTWDKKMEEVFSQIKRACEGSDYTRILCCGKPATTKYYQQWMGRVFNKQVEVHITTDFLEKRKLRFTHWIDR